MTVVVGSSPASRAITDDDVRRMNDWAINAYTAMKGGE